MTQSTYRRALFESLVYDESGNLIETTFLGQDPYYIVMDGDFKRHVPAEEIDGQVIAWIKQQATANKELVSDQIMQFLGKDDLFTKAMIDSSIATMDKQVMQQGMPDDARMMLGMMGFKIIVNIHGEVVDLEMPTQELPDDEWWMQLDKMTNDHKKWGIVAPQGGLCYNVRLYIGRLDRVLGRL